MIIALSVIVVLILLAITGWLSYVHGTKIGTAHVEAKWEKLRRKVIAGQRVQVPGFGDVMVLGLGETDDGTEMIDYIPLIVLDGRLPSELEEQELNLNTISCPFDNFIAQCELSIKYL